MCVRERALVRNSKRLKCGNIADVEDVFAWKIGNVATRSMENNEFHGTATERMKRVKWSGGAVSVCAVIWKHTAPNLYRVDPMTRDWVLQRRFYSTNALLRLYSLLSVRFHKFSTWHSMYTHTHARGLLSSCCFLLLFSLLNCKHSLNILFSFLDFFYCCAFIFHKCALSFMPQFSYISMDIPLLSLFSSPAASEDSQIHDLSLYHLALALSYNTDFSLDIPLCCAVQFPILSPPPPSQNAVRSPPENLILFVFGWITFT